MASSVDPWPIVSLSLSIAILACRGIHAAPSRSNELLLSRRAASNDTNSSDPSQAKGGLTVQVWAPVVAIVFVIIVMIIFSCIKRWRYNNLTANARANNRLGANTSTVELSAELLSGPPGRTARRPRRTRRTPSQISTRSLPAYMEDPGDSEMVLVRGAREMQDPMPTVREGDVSLNASLSVNSLGANMSETSQTHLLSSQSNLVPSNPLDGTVRPSMDTLHNNSGSDDSNHALLAQGAHSRQPSAGEIQARGEAPPYFEFDLAENREIMSPIGASITSQPSESFSRSRAATPSEVTVTNNPAMSSRRSAARQSGIRNLASRLSQLFPSSSSPPTPPPSSIRAAPAAYPPADGSPSLGSSSHERHPSTNSASSSSLADTLPHTRSLRSLRSDPSATNLTSPSVTSFGPISAPLVHTLVRTEFAYPRAGPSTEQMKFISSRDTVSKFGVPYGLAAKVQALASRDELVPDIAPPPFESPSAEAGPSAARPEAVAASSPPASVPPEDPPIDPTASTSPPPSVAELRRSTASEVISSLSPDWDLSAVYGAASSEDSSKVDVEEGLQSRSTTPTPTSVRPTSLVDSKPKKRLSPSPSTSPRHSLGISASDVPSIVIAPASPAV